MGVLNGKVAVITGSSHGLGLAIAEAYAREGAAVMLAARSSDVLNKAVEKLIRQGAKASCLPTDVGELSQVVALADHAVEIFGKIDIWVNNAGIGGVYGPTASIDPSLFERVIRANIFGEYYGSLVALQHFLSQGTGGKLLNMLGRGNRQPVKYQSAYASSKTWVRNFTLALAREYAGTGIGIYALNPGLMNTELLRKVDAVKGYEKKLKPLSAVIRLWAEPLSVPAEKAVWLASPATDKKTGLDIQVLGTGGLIKGMLRELRRIMTRRPAPDTTLDITTIAPYKMF
jgi:NAD(P)-dependent dehydrogenase (short-subunit alcohol dehydrogenase family)